MYSTALNEQCNVQDIGGHVEAVYKSDGTPLEPTPDIEELKSESMIQTGQHNEKEISLCLEKILTGAMENGIPAEDQAILEALLAEYSDLFRIRIGVGTGVRTEPMRIRLEDGEKPVRVKVRRYTVDQANFLRRKVNELE